MDTDNKARAAIEPKITMLKNAFATRRPDAAGRAREAGQGQGRVQDNQIVAKIEQLESQMKEAMKYKEAQEKELAKIGDEAARSTSTPSSTWPPRPTGSTTGTPRLAKDQAATERATDEKAKLGPTAGVRRAVPQLKRLRAPIFSEDIKLTLEGRVPMVEVTLNGSTVKKMVVDSGASTVCIPADTGQGDGADPGQDRPGDHAAVGRREAGAGEDDEAQERAGRDVHGETTSTAPCSRRSWWRPSRCSAGRS